MLNVPASMLLPDSVRCCTYFTFSPLERPAAEVREPPRFDVERRTRGKREAGCPDRIATCHRNCLPPKGRCPPVPPLRGAGHFKRGRPGAQGIEQNGTEAWLLRHESVAGSGLTQGDHGATLRAFNGWCECVTSRADGSRAPIGERRRDSQRGLRTLESCLCVGGHAPEPEGEEGSERGARSTFPPLPPDAGVVAGERDTTPGWSHPHPSADVEQGNGR